VSQGAFWKFSGPSPGSIWDLLSLAQWWRILGRLRHRSFSSHW
jgi:hypothetical protein